MSSKEKVYEYVELNDRTPVQKLSLGDQLRVLFQRITYDASLELKRNDALTIGEMRLRADLYKFVRAATDPIRKGSRKSVEMVISSEFEPVFESVFGNPRILNFYKVEITKPRIEYDIKYMIKVKMEEIK